MKLHADHVRSILLEIENTQEMGEELENQDFEKFSIYPEISRDQFAYTLQKLNEANYINADFYFGDDELNRISVNEITFEGHQFLDAIRDDGIWKDTKGVLGKLSATPISTIKQVANAVLSAYVQQQLGLK